MTDITRSNYQELLPVIKQQIQDATFISFDAEFSGLGPPQGGKRLSLFDTGSDRYEKMRGIVLQNSAPQIGFCIFRKVGDDTENLYHVDGYQAYVAEPSFASFNNEKNVTLSLEYKCGKFLRKCKFDFNSFVDKSVPYLNCNRTEDLTDYLDLNPDVFWTNPGRYFDEILFPRAETEGKESYTAEDKSNIVKRLRGMSEIVDVIREHNIPVVGHNFALDLLYFFQMFCTDLPDNYKTFKATVSTYLPRIYDTKFMIVSCKNMLQSHPAYRNNQDKDKLGSSSLFTAFLNTSKLNDRFRPHVKMNSTCDHFEKGLELGRESDLEVEEDGTHRQLIHNPGFDACTTGILFLNVAHITARIDKNFDQRTGPPTRAELFQNVQAWKDQVFISRAAVLAMYLSGNDPKPCRPRWVEVSSANEIDFPELKKSLVELGSQVDVEQINGFTFRYAAAGGKCAKIIKKHLSEKGYKVKPIEMPYNKGIRDPVYDRSTLLG